LAVGYAVGAAAAAAVTLPFLLVAIVIAVSLVRRVDQFLPSATGGGERPVAIAYPIRVRTAVAIFVWGLVMLFAGLPVAAIAWKAAGGGTPGGADVGRLAESLGRLARSDGWVLGESLLTAAVAGIITAALAWLACGLALRSRWFAGFLLVLCVVLWMTPGPLIGFGFKDVFTGLMVIEECVVNGAELRLSVLPIRSLVYDQPSPVPVVWAAVTRLFPLAVAITWPAVRAVPKELLDLAAVDGLGVPAFFRRVLTPVAGRAVPIAAVAVAALALGEVSAGKVVAPPGYRAFVLDLFAQMHYGTDATVCGLCLMQLAATAAGLGGVWLVWARTSRRMTNMSPMPVPSPFARTE
jgi:iron(III) transport system permease protein